MKSNPGAIQRDTIYPKETIMQYVGWGDFAMRSARRSGLKVLRAGKRVFVRGEDFSDWLTSQTRASEPAAIAASK